MSLAEPDAETIFDDLERELIAGVLDGSVIVKKCRMAVNAIILPFMVRTVANPASPFGSRVEASNYITKIADLAPKLNAQANVGTALQINITLPPQNPDTPTLRNITPEPEAPSITIDLASTPAPQPDALPPMPTYLRVPDFKLTNDLIGPTLPSPRS